MARVRPEERLAALWRRRAGIDYSDFDAVLDVPRPDDVRGREPAYDVYQPLPHRTADGLTVKALRHTVAALIATGYPLSFGEYHLAVAFGFLLADGVPYETFYRTRWHETATHRAYTARRTCGTCARERAAARPAAR